jgi:hypothetical protein
MEPVSQTKFSAQVGRQLATLKIVSRLLSHELHAQSNSKSITLSKDEVNEIQTTLDLFIEQVGRSGSPGSLGASSLASEPALVASRNN